MQLSASEELIHLRWTCSNAKNEGVAATHLRLARQSSSNSKMISTAVELVRSQ